MACNLEGRNIIHLNPLTNYDPRVHNPNWKLNSQWAPNYYVMPENEGMLTAMDPGGRLSLSNVPDSRVMLLASSPGKSAFNGVAQSLCKLFWGQTAIYMNRNNINRIIQLNSPGISADAPGILNGSPGGIGYDLGGDSHTAALFAYMDGVLPIFVWVRA